jgi:hypothetical protein
MCAIKWWFLSMDLSGNNGEIILLLANFLF